MERFYIISIILIITLVILISFSIHYSLTNPYTFKPPIVTDCKADCPKLGMEYFRANYGFCVNSECWCFDGNRTIKIW